MESSTAWDADYSLVIRSIHDTMCVPLPQYLIIISYNGTGLNACEVILILFGKDECSDFKKFSWIRFARKFSRWAYFPRGWSDQFSAILMTPYFSSSFQMAIKETEQPYATGIATPRRPFLLTSLEGMTENVILIRISKVENPRNVKKYQMLSFGWLNSSCLKSLFMKNILRISEPRL